MTLLDQPRTTGFVPVGRTAGPPRLRTIIAPWVELQALDASEPFFDDFKIVGKAKPQMLPNMGNADPVAWGSMLIDTVETYKRNCMIFRYVGNAILYHHGIHETRPVLEYHSGMARSGRVPAVQAIASCLMQNLRVLGDNEIPFRSPLEILVTVAYGRGDQSNYVCSDELAVLFNLLAQAVGIPAWFVISSRTHQLTVECEVEVSRRGKPASIMSFDPRSGRVNVMAEKPASNDRIEFHATQDDGANVGRTSYQLLPAVQGRYPKELQQLVGSGDSSRSRYWAKPQQMPSWYPDLKRARDRYQPSMHDAFLKRPVHRMQKTIVADNFGPPVTGAIIAYMTKLYVEQYGTLFRKIILDEMKARGRHDAEQLAATAMNLNNPGWANAQLELADAIAKIIKENFAYREEMWKVEEIISPLMQWELQAFRPHEQCHDCDDLSVNTMTCWESFRIASAVRLAGDAGKSFQYHVYPIAVINGNAHVFDVSGLNIYKEMPHGGNKHDFIPRDPETFMGAFPERQRIETAVVNGCDCIRVVEQQKATLL